MWVFLSPLTESNGTKKMALPNWSEFWKECVTLWPYPVPQLVELDLSHFCFTRRGELFSAFDYARILCKLTFGGLGLGKRYIFIIIV